MTDMAKKKKTAALAATMTLLVTGVIAYLLSLLPLWIFSVMGAGVAIAFIWYCLYRIWLVD